MSMTSCAQPPYQPCPRCQRLMHPRRRRHRCPGAPAAKPVSLAAHCTWCADPYRAAVLLLPRQRVSLHATARYLGLAPTTVVGLVAEARERGCLPWPSCPYCPTRTPEGGPCEAEACLRRYRADVAANNRARLRAGGKAGKRGGRRRTEVPPGVVLLRLPLPPSPRQRKGQRLPPGPPPGAVLSPGPCTPTLGSLWPHTAKGGGR